MVLWIPSAIFLYAYRTLTFYGWLSHTILLGQIIRMTVRTPAVLLPPVWPLPLSLATTRGISVDFSSSGYLDVSVPRVPHVTLCIYVTFHGSSPWVFPHSEICGYNAHLRLPAAYRSLSRPSSAPDAKAFTLCSCSLELLFVLTILVLISAELLEFLQIKFGIIFSRERFSLLHFCLIPLP